MLHLPAKIHLEEEKQMANKKPRTARLMRFLLKYPMRFKIVCAMCSKIKDPEERAINIIDTALSFRISANLKRNDGAAASRYYNRFYEDEAFKAAACEAILKKLEDKKLIEYFSDDSSMAKPNE